MGERFHASAGERDEFEPAAFLAFATALSDAPDGLVLVSPGGFLMAARVALPWSTTARQVHEIFWWSEDGHGVDLLRAMERWAGDDEIKLSFRIKQRGPALARLVARLGYTGTEAGFTKCAYLQ